MTDEQTAGYQPPVMAPPSATNGLAIASLVLAIVNLCGLGSLLAIIFGHVSLGQIKRSHQPGRGIAIAGTILGYIGAVAALLLFAAVARGVHEFDQETRRDGFVDKHGVRTSSNNRKHPPQADVTLTGCAANTHGSPTATFSVTNHSSRWSDYWIEVAFDDKQRGGEPATAAASATEVEPNQTTTAVATADSQVRSARFTCRLVEVDRSASGFEVDGVHTRSDNHIHAPQADVSPPRCQPDANGSFAATFDVTNQSSALSDYTITIAFDSASRRVATADADVPLLRPDETTTAVATTRLPASPGLTCRVLVVDRTASDDLFASVDSNGVRSYLSDPTVPAQADAAISSCTSAGGRAVAGVRLTNHSKAAGNYSVVVAFDGTGDRRLATATAEFPRLAAGKSTDITARAEVQTTAKVGCRLIEVDRLPEK